VEIVASLEIGTSIRWDSIQSWLEQAVAVLLRAISKHLEAPEVWDGRQIVLASGGRIQSSSSASNVEINLNVLVPPTSNLSSNSRRLVSTELVSTTYQDRVQLWQNILVVLGESAGFAEDVAAGLELVGLPSLPGMSFHFSVLGLEEHEPQSRQNQTGSDLSFVVDTSVGQDITATAGNTPAGHVAGTLLPVVLIILCLNVCIVSRLRCVKQRLEKLYGILSDQALKTGARILPEGAVTALKDIPFTPSPSKRTKPQTSGSGTGSGARAQMFGSKATPASSQQSDGIGTRSTDLLLWQSDGSRSVSGSRHQIEACGPGSGSRGKSDSLVASPECCGSLAPITGSIGSHESDDITVCSFTSSPQTSPQASHDRRSIRSPEVKIPLRRDPSPEVVTPLDKDPQGFPEQARSTFSLEDVSPAPNIACQMSNAVNTEATDGQPRFTLNSIFGVRPPQPPRHKSRPQPAGPPLRESLEEFDEPPQIEQEPRFGDWISFSPLRHMIRGKPSHEPQNTSSPSRAAAKRMLQKLAEVGRMHSAGSQQEVREGTETGMPKMVPSPARQRKGRPRALDDGFDEAGASPSLRSRKSGSAASTPHRDTCLQVGSPSPFLDGDAEWTPSGFDHRFMLTSPRMPARAAFDASPTALTFGSALGSGGTFDSGLPNRICTPTAPWLPGVKKEDFA